MPTQLSPKRQIKGLYSNVNRSALIPEGGLLEADNCIVERPGLLSKRRGFNRYGDELSALPESLMEYDGSLVVHNGINISCDASGDGSFTTWGDKYQAPGPTHNIRGIGFKDNFYFTSSDGVYRNDSTTGTPSLAGLPEGLDIEIEKYGTGDGWFANDRQVGYRIIWTRKDANKSLMFSEPSYRHVVANRKKAVTLDYDAAGFIVVSSHTNHGFSHGDIITISGVDPEEYGGVGKVITVIDEDSYKYEYSTDLGSGKSAFAGKDYFLKLTFTVPEGVVSGDKYQIHRTGASADGITDPGTDLMLVIDKEITAAEVTAGVVEFSDTVLEVSLGEFLYTNSGQETISQRNTRPPMCKDIIQWKNYIFYSDLSYRAEKEFHLSEIEDLSDGDSISIKVGARTLTYKFSLSEDAEERMFKLVTDEDTTEENIEFTARGLVRVINRDPNNDLLYAHYSSGIDDASGKVLIRTRSPALGDFSITASSSTVGDSFKEPIPTSGEDFAPEVSTVPNGLAYSKLLEPDAVPDINIIFIGSRAEPIQRIFPLKNALIILKNDGVYKLSGNSPASFLLQVLDPAVSCRFPKAAALLNDAVYCLSTQGIVRVNENGTVAIGFAIEDRVRNIASYNGCAKMAFAVANEEARHIVIFTQKDSGDLNAKIGWVYNYLTKEWTTWSKPVSCGISLLGQREMYLGHAHDEYILKERRGVSRRNSGDYMDEDITVQLGGTPTTTIEFTYDYDVPIRAGFLFTQASTDPNAGGSSKIKSITSIAGAARPFTVTAVLESAIAGIAATTADHTHKVSLPIDSLVKWAPQNLGMSEHPKQFSQAIITMESSTALTNEMGFYSDAVPVSEWVGPIVLNTPIGWGQGAWGTSGWGDTETVAVVPLVSPVPRQHQRCRELTLMFRHRVANEEFNIESVALKFKAYTGTLVRTPD